MAPMLDIIVRILIDIGYFMVILVLMGLVFATQFYLVAQNQVMFDDLSEKEKGDLNYKTFTSAWWYTYDIVLGGADRENFDIGTNSSQSNTLYILYTLSTFIMLIHLTNMLIAIMGETFSTRGAVADQIKVKDHLRFVMDHWHLSNLSFKAKKKIKYIITAFHISEEQNDSQQITNLREDVKMVGQ